MTAWQKLLRRQMATIVRMGHTDRAITHLFLATHSKPCWRRTAELTKPPRKPPQELS